MLASYTSGMPTETTSPMQPFRQSSDPTAEPVQEDRPVASSSASDLDNLYNDAVLKRLNDRYGLSAFTRSLESALKNAGTLYLRYSRRNARAAYDLAPKCRTIARIAEIARALDRELNELDFWDRWQVYKHLEITGHPITESLDAHTKTNPLVAGDIVVEEIHLILNAVSRFEKEFFETFERNSLDDADIGLTFFVQVMGAFWESVTGGNLAGLADHDQRLESGIAFLQDCLEPLDQVEASEFIKVMKSR